MATVNALLERLSPEVVEIMRRDLIQKVGNALRYARNTEVDKEELERFAAREIHNETSSWATW